MKRKQKIEQAVKELMQSTVNEIQEERKRKNNILKLNLERTRYLLLSSFSPEQKQLFDEYEQANADYCNFLVESKF